MNRITDDLINARVDNISDLILGYAQQKGEDDTSGDLALERFLERDKTIRAAVILREFGGRQRSIDLRNTQYGAENLNPAKLRRGQRDGAD